MMTRNKRLVRSARLALLIVVSAGCDHERGPMGQAGLVGSADAADQDAALDAAIPSPPLDDDPATRHDDSITRTLTELHYEIIQQWVREHEFGGFAYDEIVALAPASEAASRYVACHEATKSPSHKISRIEALSVCLRREAPRAEPAGGETASDAPAAGAAAPVETADSAR